MVTALVGVVRVVGELVSVEVAAAQGVRASAMSSFSRDVLIPSRSSGIRRSGRLVSSVIRDSSMLDGSFVMKAFRPVSKGVEPCSRAIVGVSRSLSYSL